MDIGGDIRIKCPHCGVVESAVPAALRLLAAQEPPALQSHCRWCHFTSSFELEVRLVWLLELLGVPTVEGAPPVSVEEIGVFSRSSLAYFNARLQAEL